MNKKCLTRVSCLLTATVLKAAQRVCLPLLPDAPLTATRLAGEGLFLLLALGIGLGMAACCLDLDGRGFIGLLGRCAGVSLLCKGTGLLGWQLLGSHWVVALYASEAATVLGCGWCLRRAGAGRRRFSGRWFERDAGMWAEHTSQSTRTTSRPQPLWLAVLLITLLACAWIQVFVCRRCQPFAVNTLSYQSILRHLSLPIAVGEWLLYLVCCWLMLPMLPEAWQAKRGAIISVLLPSGCLVALGLVDGLLKPEGFLKGMRQAAAITRQSLDWTATQPWYSETAGWWVTRRQGDTIEDREWLRLLTLRDDQGHTTARALLTEPLMEETLLLEGQPVELLHPYGLLLPHGETLRLVRLADLPKQEEHPLLTAFCHARLADFRLLPSVGGYLHRHDPEAVRPLLERYVAADFTPEEAAAMGDIDPEWVSRTACGLLAAP